MVEVITEVTGTVWQVVVAVGSNVEAEAEIVVLESMKMEIPILTPVAGTLTELRVETGHSVKAGEVVAVVEES